LVTALVDSFLAKSLPRLVHGHGLSYDFTC